LPSISLSPFPASHSPPLPASHSPPLPASHSPSLLLLSWPSYSYQYDLTFQCSFFCSLNLQRSLSSAFHYWGQVKDPGRCLRELQ
ncbi:hypothetical protein FKM82_025629, partial [Ascaphus truei]